MSEIRWYEREFHHCHMYMLLLALLSLYIAQGTLWRKQCIVGSDSVQESGEYSVYCLTGLVMTLHEIQHSHLYVHVELPVCCSVGTLYTMGAGIAGEGWSR